MKTDFLHSEKTANALRWMKTLTMIFIIVNSAMMADTAFHILTAEKLRNLLTLRGFWLATSSLLLFLSWKRITPFIARKISTRSYYILSTILAIIALFSLYIAAQPVTNIVIWISPTIRLAHRSYPSYLELWVKACTMFGIAAFITGNLDLILDEQTIEH